MKKILLPLLACLLFVGCKTAKYIYLEDMPVDHPIAITNKMETRIKPKDRLAIHVTCKKQELATPFNSPSFRVTATGDAAITDLLTQEGYLVDDKGYINFPVLGQLNVGGLTMKQVSDYIAQRLVEGKHIPDATVETTITNFTIYGLGALSPGKLTVKNGHINLLQAIAQMGDLQGRAKIQKVRVIREDDGQRMEFDVDLTTKALYDSPAFYLQQNDMVYAEPRKRKADVETKTFTYISLLAALASIAYTTAYILK